MADSKEQKVDEQQGYREEDKSLGPHANMRPNRFPKSQHTKDQRKDAEQMLKDEQDRKDNRLPGDDN